VDNSAVNDQIMMMVNQAIDNLTNGLFPDLYSLFTVLITLSLVILGSNLICSAIDSHYHRDHSDHPAAYGFIRRKYYIFDGSGKVIGSKNVDEKFNDL
jgi:hypothetical protein